MQLRIVFSWLWYLKILPLSVLNAFFNALTKLKLGKAPTSSFSRKRSANYLIQLLFRFSPNFEGAVHVICLHDDQEFW